VQAGKADLIRALAHSAENLGGDDDVLAARAESFAEHGLGFAGGINVGGVDKVDSGVE